MAPAAKAQGTPAITPSPSPEEPCPAQPRSWPGNSRSTSRLVLQGCKCRPSHLAPACAPVSLLGVSRRHCVVSMSLGAEARLSLAAGCLGSLHGSVLWGTLHSESRQCEPWVPSCPPALCRRGDMRARAASPRLLPLVPRRAWCKPGVQCCTGGGGCESREAPDGLCTVRTS